MLMLRCVRGAGVAATKRSTAFRSSSLSSTPALLRLHDRFPACRFLSSGPNDEGDDNFDFGDLEQLTAEFQKKQDAAGGDVALPTDSDSVDDTSYDAYSDELNSLSAGVGSGNQDNFENFEQAFSAIQFDGDMPSLFDDEPVEERDEYADILDRDNPPKLTREHYAMLQDVATVGLSEEERAKYEAVELAKRQKDAFIWEDKFGITREMYDVYLSNFPMADETVDFSHKPVPTKGYDFAREPGRTFDPRDYKALEQVPHWKPMPRGRHPGQCKFCDEDVTPERVDQISYTNVELLYDYINERGMILNRRRSHVCAKHQRKLCKSIKRARQLGLIPYISNWRVPLSTDFGADAFAKPETRDWHEVKDEELQQGNEDLAR